ncbi:hypothetical protein [Clostridium sp. ZS2-4]|nr:hypothetical protein [Clostridium sp. ZS2-4]MCY6356492.1 hypothetical protein [Clostridium sp. ZS2-4]
MVGGRMQVLDILNDFKEVKQVLDMDINTKYVKLSKIKNMI